MGKTWLFFDCLIKSKATNVLMFAETTVREKTIQDDRQKYKETFGIDPFENRNVIFMCYQSGNKQTIRSLFPKGKIFVFNDEAHEMVSPSRWKIITMNDWKGIYFLGVSATIDKTGIFEIDGVLDTKWNFINSFAPVVFEYNVDSAQVDGTTRHLDVITYLHQIDKVNKNVLTGTKDKKWFTTEVVQLDYLTRALGKAMWLPPSLNKSKTIQFLARNRMAFIHSLPSKIEACKHLLSILPGRTLVFAYDSKTLIALGIPAIVAENKNMDRDLDDFMNFRINQIGSNKILLQGANLPKVDNIVYFAYDSKEGKAKQKAGRARGDLNVGKIIVFKTVGTQEEKWYESMIQPLLVFPQKEVTKIEDCI